MTTINKRRSYSNDTSSSVVMKRILRKCVSHLEKQSNGHEWNCDCNGCILLREILKEI